MKLVNPLGRTVDTLESKADYVSPRSGCVCSGPSGTAASHNKGSGWCVGYCGGETTETRHENMLNAKNSIKVAGLEEEILLRYPIVSLPYLDWG